MTEILDRMLSGIFESQWLVFILVLLLLLGFTELGFFTGRKLFKKDDQQRKGIISSIQAAILGIVGLLLGFTFSMALERYEARRDLVIQESNAIGTTYLRASLLPVEQKSTVERLLQEYLKVRLSFYDAGASREKIMIVEKKTQDLQRLLWQESTAASESSPNAVTVAFINSLNETIDLDATRLFALTNKVPAAAWLMVLIVACAGCYASGYSTGVYGVRSAMSGILLPILITIVITLIADLDRSRRGLVRIDQHPLINLETLIIKDSR